MQHSFEKKQLQVNINHGETGKFDSKLTHFQSSIVRPNGWKGTGHQKKNPQRFQQEGKLWQAAVITAITFNIIFQPQEEDFATLEAFNTFLEDIEDIIFNLCNNIDILETNKRIEQYKKDNRDQIMKNKQRMGKEEMELEILLEQEKEIAEMRKKELESLEEQSKKKKTLEKEKLIDELMFSSENAQSILQTYANKVEEEKKEQELAPPPTKITKFSSGVRFSSQMQQQYLPIPKVDEGPLYEYEEPEIILNGPFVPPLNEIEARKYTKHIRAEGPVERAGGFQSKISCLRALQEAMQGLYPF